MPGHDAEGMALLHNIRSCPSPPSRGQAPAGIQPWIPAFAGMSGGCRSDLFVKQPSLKQPSLKQPSLSNRHASSPVLFGEAPGRPVFPLSPLKNEGDGAPRGATIVLDVPAFPLGNTGRRSARHPDKLARSGLICGVFLPAPGRAFRGRPKHGRPPSAKLLAGGSYWPPGGAPAPPGCVLCEARPQAPHPTPPA